MAPGIVVESEHHWGNDGNAAYLSRAAQSGADNIPSSRDHDTTEPLAIVGISLRFPQEAVTEEGFWDTLIQQKNTFTVFPEDRLSASAIYHADSRRRGTVSTCADLWSTEIMLNAYLHKVAVRGGHFVKESIAAFDTAFFSIPLAEAAALDPQQRGLLETTYRALENGKWLPSRTWLPSTA